MEPTGFVPRKVPLEFPVTLPLIVVVVPPALVELALRLAAAADIAVFDPPVVDLFPVIAAGRVVVFVLVGSQWVGDQFVHPWPAPVLLALEQVVPVLGLPAHSETAFVHCQPLADLAPAHPDLQLDYLVLWLVVLALAPEAVVCTLPVVTELLVQD